jgi:DNA-binding response OmpR family regulator
LVKTILVLDTDLGFVAYLCSTLTKAGYRALPATTADRAERLLKELNVSHVDALVVNLKMAGGVKLGRMLSRKGAKLIAIEGTGRSEFQAFQIAATLRRSEGPSASVEREWLRHMREVLGEA